MNASDLNGLGMWKNWSDVVKKGLPNFAADALYATQNNLSVGRFEEVAKQVMAFGPVDMDGRNRDEEFGARMVETCLGRVNRMWLDSNVEIDFLKRHLPNLSGLSALDIGAGYGRLAVMLQPCVKEMTCVDAVPVSTELCRKYTQRFRPQVKVLTIDELAQGDFHFDLAINVHSFNECPMAQIKGWINAVLELGGQHLFLVDHGETLETSYKAWDSNMASFKPALEEKFYMVAQESLGLSHNTHSLWTRK